TCEIRGAANLSGTAGDDTLLVTNSLFAKNLTASMGGGSNSLTLSTPNILGKLSVTSGTGGDTVTIDGAAQIVGTTSINTGLNPLAGPSDTVNIDDSSFWSAVSIVFGSSDDLLNVAQSSSFQVNFVEKLTVNMGAGDDIARFGTVSTPTI